MTTAAEMSDMLLQEPEINREDILILLDDDFNQRNVCLVTGAASGIGRATAIALAANGLTTVGLDIDERGGQETQEMARKLGGKVAFLKTDLRCDAQIESAVAKAAEFGHIKYLANIAGLQHIDPVEDFPLEKYDQMHRIMLRAPFYLAKLTIPHMKDSATATGVIGNMASIHAHVCTINKPAYNIMKFGLRGLTQSIAAEGNAGIRSFTISTGFVKTQLTLNQIPDQARQRGISPEDVVKNAMMGRSRIKEMMPPVDVANLFVFGFSRYSRYLIGGDLLFDGGVVLTY
jgi:3-hydroxybutyrate dehydrogenase